MPSLRLLFWLATATYWVGLCVLTHLPPQHLPHVGINDKVVHLLAYGMLAGLIAMALWVTFPRRAWLIWAVLFVGLAYGAVDELTQQRFVRLPDARRPARRRRAAGASPIASAGGLGPDLEAALDTLGAEGPASASSRPAHQKAPRAGARSQAS